MTIKPFCQCRKEHSPTPPFSISRHLIQKHIQVTKKQRKKIQIMWLFSSHWKSFSFFLKTLWWKICMSNKKLRFLYYVFLQLNLLTDCSKNKEWSVKAANIPRSSQLSASQATKPVGSCLCRTTLLVLCEAPGTWWVSVLLSWLKDEPCDKLWITQSEVHLLLHITLFWET